TLPLTLVVTDVCAVLKVMVLPSTVKDDPSAGVVASVSAFTAETSLVAAVIGAGTVWLLLTAVPVTVLLGGLPSRLFTVAPGMIPQPTFDLLASPLGLSTPRLPR